MKFLCGPSKKVILDDVTSNNLNVYNVPFDVHPSILLVTVEEFIRSCEENADAGIYMTNNITALNYIDSSHVLWVDTLEDGTTIVQPWDETFISFSPLNVGDTYQIVTHPHTTTKKVIMDSKVVYRFSE